MDPHALYNALIRRSIDMRALYRDAATQAQEPGLRAVLGENAAALGQLIGELQAQIRGSGAEPASHGRFAGQAQRHLAAWLLPSAPYRDQAWIRRLARSEAALLQAFERGIEQAPADAALVLRRQLPRLQGIHLDMHSLARAGRC
ncbi:hypothetical protein ASG87_10450 [Frateuria sp. Soil773]|uniref:PA2169 family four-helix-bundle protein n=1 Tax=Frateuria sp. Soil773 TaxID=1736407 RepID=UPI0006F9B26D|nr:PA2169 family four-helix-bundle protein [Frateuria sp. Soil773]KRF01917.1 hypothetical protein ASG87_10450 [Frateuria sp. Soil773]